MHSVLSSFFHGPVSGEEKKKRLQQRVACKSISNAASIKTNRPLLIAERALQKDPARHELSLEQMIENDYPIPSYMADIFQKPEGWVETPETPKESLLSVSQQKAKVYAIDCEMVCNISILVNIDFDTFLSA